MDMHCRPQTDSPSQHKKTLLPGPGYCKPMCPPSLKGSSLSARIERISLARAKNAVATPQAKPRGPAFTPPRTRERFAKQLLEQSRTPRFEEDPEGDETDTAKEQEGNGKALGLDAAQGAGEQGMAKGVPLVQGASLFAREVAAATVEKQESDRNEAAQETRGGNLCTKGDKRVEDDKAATKDDEKETDSSEMGRKGSAQAAEEKEDGVIVHPRPKGGLVEVAASVVGISTTKFQASALLRKKSSARSSVGSKS